MALSLRGKIQNRIMCMLKEHKYYPSDEYFIEWECAYCEKIHVHR